MNGIQLVNDVTTYIARDKSKDIVFCGHNISYREQIGGVLKGWHWETYGTEHEKDFFEFDHEITENMWQDYIIWGEVFDDINFDGFHTYPFIGEKEKKMFVGDTIVAEYPMYYFKFEAVEVDYPYGDLSNKFNGRAFPIDVMKKVFE